MDYTAENITIIIMTVYREDPYIHSTLESLFSQSRGKNITVNLMVGGPDSAYLEKYRTDNRIILHELTEGEWNTIKDKGPHYKLIFNYWRCLKLASREKQAALICEDDIEFAPDFWNIFKESVDEAAGLVRETPFILSLYSAYYPPQGFKYISLYPPYSFYGTQCIFYHPEAVSPAENYIDTHGVKTHKEPADILVGRFSHNNVPLFQTRVSIVQHKGYQTTGTSGRYFYSFTYGKSWEQVYSLNWPKKYWPAARWMRKLLYRMVKSQNIIYKTKLLTEVIKSIEEKNENEFKNFISYNEKQKAVMQYFHKRQLKILNKLLNKTPST